MARFVLKSAAVKIASVDLSTLVSEVSVDMSSDEVDMSGMGDISKTRKPGLRDDQFSITFWQDFAAGSVDATLSPIYSGQSSVLVEVWANGTTTSSTNPKFSGTAELYEYHPISGGVADGASTETTWLVGGAGIVRATA